MAKSKEELIYDIENELVDPTTNKVTGERVKARLLDMVDAMGEGGGGGQYKYYALDEGADATEFMYVLSAVLKVHSNNDSPVISIAPPVMYGDMSLFTIDAVAVDMSLRIIMQGQDMTVGDYFNMVLEMQGLGSLDEIGAHEITKEAFYTI